MMTRQWTAGVVAAVISGLVAGVSLGDVISFKQGVDGYTGTDDNMMYGGARANLNAGTYHLGAGDGPWEVAGVRSLLRFDLSGFAFDYSAINSITLKLYHDGPAKTGINVYAIKPVNSDWVEGTKGFVAETGSSCWNYRQYSSVSWAGSAGCGTAGTDYDATSLATFSTPAATTFITIPLTGHGGLTLKDLVDQWSGPQADNAGLLIKADVETDGSDRGWFSSSEDSMGAGTAPELIIDYEPSGAETISFKQGVNGYTGTDDNMMYSSARADRNGGGYHIGAGDGPWNTPAVTRSLLRFDLSGFAFNYSAINSITLKLYHNGAAKTGLNIYPIMPANEDWSEGTGDLNPGSEQTGASCWNYKKYTSANWAGSAGCGTAGTDYDATSLATFSTPAATTFITIPLTGHGGLTLKDLVDQWSGSQADNAGLLIKADDESDGSGRGWFSSSEDSMGAGTAPELIINYQPTGAESITFKQGGTNDFVTGYVGTDDIMLYGGARGNRNGGGYHIGAGDGPWEVAGVRSLIRFDLSALEYQYDAINSISLRLYANGPAKTDINIYPVKPANDDWVEGTGDLNPGSEQTGASCWNYKKYTSENWAGSAGCGTADTDYDSVSLATFATDGSSGYINIPLTGHGGMTLKDLIDQWSGDQADNAGLLIKADVETDGSDRGWFSSAEELVGPGTAPELIINYQPAAVVAQTISFQQGGTNALVSNYQGTDDNAIYATERVNQNAGAWALAVGDSPWSAAAMRTLLRFDLTPLDGLYGDIISMTLKLDPGENAKSGINVYAIKPVNAGWVEGTAQWAVQTGSSCWNYTKYNTETWAGSVGCGTTGVDYDPVSLATFSTDAAGSVVTIPLTGHAGLSLRTLLKQWTGDQAYNAGLLIKADDESDGSGYSWFGRSDPNTGDRLPPELIIQYWPPIQGTLIILN